MNFPFLDPLDPDPADGFPPAPAIADAAWAPDDTPASSRFPATPPSNRGENREEWRHPRPDTGDMDDAERELAHECGDIWDELAQDNEAYARSGEEGWFYTDND
jgi:hypothetical protein